MHERRIRAEAIPRHVAVIMDGNGRWAERQGLDRVQGHRAGIEAVRATVRAAHELGVRFLTLYAFSTENWSRPEGRSRRADGTARALPRRRARGARPQRHPPARDRPPRAAARRGAQEARRGAGAHARQPRDDGGLRAVLRRAHRDRRRGAQARARRRSGQARSRNRSTRRPSAPISTTRRSRIPIC